MGDDKEPPSLQGLGERLRAAREHQGDDTQQKQSLSGGPPGMGGLGWALRIGVEMVSALAVGVGIGYALDWWLGTKPWFLVVFFLLGSAAAILNVYRAAMGYGLSVGYREPDAGGQDSATRNQGVDEARGSGTRKDPGNSEGER